MSRTVFANDMVAHVWAQRSQPYGRTSNGSFSFDGSVLLSYREPIALFCKGSKKRDVCLITSRSFSVTTAKHTGLARRAVHGVPVFRVPYLTTTDAGDRMTSHMRLSDSRLTLRQARKTHKANLAYLVKEYADLCGTFKRAKNLYIASETELYGRLADSRNVANQYALLFGLPVPKIDAAKDASTIWAYRTEREARLATPEHQAKLERARERREQRKEEEEERERQERYSSSLDQFVVYMQGDSGYYGHRHPPVYEFPVDSIERRYLENAERERNLAAGRIALEAFRAWQAGNGPLPERLSQHVSWADDERAQFAAAHEALKREKLANEIAAWRDGGVTPYSLHALSPMLRLRLSLIAGSSKIQHVIETSRGASFPLKHALRAIPHVLRCQSRGIGWKANGHTIALGHFTISEIEPNGNVRAGCHYVEFAEIAALVDTLRERGLYPKTTEVTADAESEMPSV